MTTIKFLLVEIGIVTNDVESLFLRLNDIFLIVLFINNIASKYFSFIFPKVLILVISINFKVLLFYDNHNTFTYSSFYPNWTQSFWFGRIIFRRFTNMRVNIFRSLIWFVFFDIWQLKENLDNWRSRNFVPFCGHYYPFRKVLFLNTILSEIVDPNFFLNHHSMKKEISTEHVLLDGNHNIKFEEIQLLLFVGGQRNWMVKEAIEVHKHNNFNRLWNMKTLKF